MQYGVYAYLSAPRHVRHDQLRHNDVGLLPYAGPLPSRDPPLAPFARITTFTSRNTNLLLTPPLYSLELQLDTRPPSK
jgi:hypothetical protein